MTDYDRNEATWDGTKSGSKLCHDSFTMCNYQTILDIANLFMEITLNFKKIFFFKVKRDSKTECALKKLQNYGWSHIFGFLFGKTVFVLKSTEQHEREMLW